MARAICQISFDLGIAHEEQCLQLIHSLPLPLPPPPRHIVVRITLRPIHPTDLVTIRLGRFAHLSDQPAIIGSEGFGIVDEVGEGVTKFKKGQRVVPLNWENYFKYGQGTWQDYVVLDEKDAFAVPDDVSDEVAAQFIVNPWTVYGLLETLAVPEGEYILQTAANSVLGRQLIQLAKHRGIKTINIVRRDEWKEELKALGADEVINSSTEDMLAKVREITGGKLAYGAIDAVAGTLTKSVATCVRNGGKVLLYGALSGWDVSLNILDFIRGLKVEWWYLPDYIGSLEKRDQVALEVMRLLQKNIISPLVGNKFSLLDFQSAIKESKRGGHKGKILLAS